MYEERVILANYCKRGEDAAVLQSDAAMLPEQPSRTYRVLGVFDVNKRLTAKEWGLDVAAKPTSIENALASTVNWSKGYLYISVPASLLNRTGVNIAF